MFIEFDKEYLRELFEQGHTRDKKLKRSETIEELYRINSLNYEVLQGDKAGISSIRINRKYRLEFTVREVMNEQIITVCRLLEISNHYKQ